MREATEKMITEWKVSMENARHFNDLLIRFRMFGLPMVVTLSIAGIASSQFVASIELWKFTMPLVTLSISISGLVALFWHTIRKLKFEKVANKEEHERKQEPPLLISWFETILWAIFVLTISVFTVVNFYNAAGYSNTTTYSLAPIVLIAAVTLLIVLYTMDRFYYYKLLIGATSRLVVLEKSLEYGITETTNKFIPRDYATNLITFFYSLPGIILVMISLICLNI